eukprot:m.24674 g.24674  ORF g.24674 m.24674 type:complete len:629 (+) comp7567_c0_seq1:238-2124(+)
MGDALPAPAGGMHGVEGMGLELVRDPVAVTVAGGGGSASTMSPHHPNRQHHALAAEALAERAGLQLDSGGNVIGVISGVDGDADGVVGVAAATALGDHRHDAVLVTEVVDVTPQPRARPRINAKTLVDCTRLPTVPLASSTAAVATDPAVTAESTEVHASQPVSEPRVQARPTTTATTAVSTPVSTRTGTSPDVPRPRPAPRQRVHTVAAIDRSSLKAHHQHAVDPATRRVVIKLPGAASGKVVAVPRSLAELVEAAKCKLSTDDVTHFTLPNGARISDLDVIRDDDVLVAVGRRCGDSLQGPPCATGSEASRSEDGAALTTAADWIRLNVGGTVMATTRQTLCRDPESALARMFSNTSSWHSHTDHTGAFLIDRSPEYFEPVLNLLRDGELRIPVGVNAQGVLAEAEYFGLQSLIPNIEAYVQKEHSGTCVFTRDEVARILLKTSTQAALRFQGLDLSGVDLSGFDLRSCNFKLAKLQGCNLSNCNLENSCFELADLSAACLDGSNMMGCLLPRANLKDASLRKVNFHDPSQCTHASLEGACLKNADLEESNLSCVNLRVASLKGASLLNCNLRCASLAGCDLGDCDLSGCNLQGCNLRGANVVGATFAGMHTAVHMTQSVPHHGAL